MLERGVDQATGLRRSMTPHGGPVLPVAGAGEHPAFVARLAQALCDGGLRVALVSDFDDVLEQIKRGQPRRELAAMHSLEVGSGLQRLGIISASADLTLVAVDDARLARGLTMRASEAIVLASSDTQAIATAYARIKALVGLGSVRDVCTLFDRGSASADVRLGHDRLAPADLQIVGEPGAGGPGAVVVLAGEHAPAEG